MDIRIAPEALPTASTMRANATRSIGPFYFRLPSREEEVQVQVVPVCIPVRSRSGTVAFYGGRPTIVASSSSYESYES